MPPPVSILLIRPSALGDVCRTAPVLASLRRAYPEARIDWLVQDSFVAAIEHHPGLSGVVAFPRRALGEAVRRGRIGALRGFLRTLRQPRYEMVLDCQGLFRSGFFAWWTGARQRIGYANAREGGWLGLNRRRWVDPRMHAVDRMMELARAAGAEPIADMRLYTGWQEREWVASTGFAEGRYAVIAPTSRWPGKRWPAERFAEVARWLLEHGVEQVAVVGGAGEREQCGPLVEAAAEEPRVVDVIGRTSVGQLMALIQKAAVVVANDSAALHMAVGFDRPLVALYGPTDIARVGPYRRDGDVLQHVRPGERMDHKDEALGRALMERISTGEVKARLERLLGEHGGAEAGPGG
jgi:heptosyltransferase I